MLRFTRHVTEKTDALRLERKDVEKIIKKGMKWKEKDSEKWHAHMDGFEVVFVKDGEDLIVITFYASRREK